MKIDVPSCLMADPLYQELAAVIPQVSHFLVEPDEFVQELWLTAQASVSEKPVCEHVMVVVQENAQVTVRETAAMSGMVPSGTVGRIVKCHVGRNAQVDWHTLSQVAEAVNQLMVLQVSVEEGGQFTYHALHAGGHQRVYVYVDLVGVGASADIEGRYIGTDDQKIILRTYQQHEAAHTSSSCRYRGVLGGTAQCDYRGSMVIAEQAGGSRAAQEHKTVLLTEHAQVTSVPSFQVLTDDVRCNHGAAAAPIDPLQIWYLAARGIDGVTARTRILTGLLAGDGWDSEQRGWVQERLRELVCHTDNMIAERGG